ncbi:hypothetical protein B0H19DRAFT_461866 [Mycena capillaripes]|nr:hypothetical protein B0H19DRAFT_461866 [Mycena capillaripes]
MPCFFVHLDASLWGRRLETIWQRKLYSISSVLKDAKRDDEGNEDGSGTVVGGIGAHGAKDGEGNKDGWGTVVGGIGAHGATGCANRSFRMRRRARDLRTVCYARLRKTDGIDECRPTGRAFREADVGNFLQPTTRGTF